MDTSATTIPSQRAIVAKRIAAERETLDLIETEKEDRRKQAERRELLGQIALLGGYSFVVLLAGGVGGAIALQANTQGEVPAAYTNGQRSALAALKKVLLIDLNDVPLSQAIESIHVLMQYFNAYLLPLQRAGGEEFIGTSLRDLKNAQAVLEGNGVTIASLATIISFFEAWHNAPVPSIAPSTIASDDVAQAQHYLEALQSLLASFPS